MSGDSFYNGFATTMYKTQSQPQPRLSIIPQNTTGEYIPKLIKKQVQMPIYDENGNVVIDQKTNQPVLIIEERHELEDPNRIPSTLLTAQQREYLKKQPTSPAKLAMCKLQNKLNEDLGNFWWKRYITSAFWSNISTPINLVITLLTTLTTGQATTENLFDQATFVRISVAAMVISTINTFFRPHQQMNDNQEAMNKWRALGTVFEEIYYSNCFNDLDYEERTAKYKELQKKIHAEQLVQESNASTQNVLTDLIYLIATRSCLKRDNWIEEDNKPTTPQTKINMTNASSQVLPQLTNPQNTDSNITTNESQTLQTLDHLEKQLNDKMRENEVYRQQLDEMQKYAVNEREMIVKEINKTKHMHDLTVYNLESKIKELENANVLLKSKIEFHSFDTVDSVKSASFEIKPPTPMPLDINGKQETVIETAH